MRGNEPEMTKISRYFIAIVVGLLDELFRTWSTSQAFRLLLRSGDFDLMSFYILIDGKKIFQREIYPIKKIERLNHPFATPVCAIVK